MTITNGYLTLQELQDTLNGAIPGSTADYELAIESASRWIDSRCSDPATNRIRRFYQDPSPVAHVYRADTIQLVRTSDFASAVGMTVEVDAAGTGTWVALNATAWQPEPLVRLDGHPYTQITAANYATVFPLGLSGRVRVTAQWGWASVPKPVKQAAQILAVAYLQGKEVVSMHDGYDVDATGPANPVAVAEHLLKPYLPGPITDPVLTRAALA